MRESEIRLFQAQSAQRSSLAFRQFQFVNSRLQAIESLFYTMGFWSRLFYCVFPKGLKELVDAVHMKLLRDMESEYEESVKKAKEEASRPKITLVSGNV